MAKTLIARVRQIGEGYWKEILAVLLLLIAVYFFRSKRAELASLGPQLHAADAIWISIGVLVTVIYILLQSGMYVSSFAAIGAKLSWPTAIELFLKRNFLSVFLPAGGISSLTYSPSRLKKSGVDKLQIHQASGIYAFVGLFSVLLVGVPVLLYSLFHAKSIGHIQESLAIIILLLVSVFFVFRSLKQKGWLYTFITRRFPTLIPTIDKTFSANIASGQFWLTTAYSTGVEFCGILHIFIACKALGLPASFEASAIAYIVSVLLMIVSPFLRGLGAVELSMTYILGLYHYQPSHALAIIVLYRLFEFWLPLVAGFVSFAWKGRHIFVRLFPAFLVFMLGIVNVLSVVTPPIASRLRFLRGFLPIESINASNILVLVVGFVLLIISALLLRGHRSAWTLALILSAISFIGHMAKALDYEEAILAAVVLVVLALSYKQYRLRSKNGLIQLNLFTVGLVFAATFVFGFVGFYFLNVRHFGIDFTWGQSIKESLESFLVIEVKQIHPKTRFAREFLIWMDILGFLCWGLLILVLVKPFFKKKPSGNHSREKAAELVERYGSSPVDYFKTYADKLLFFSDVTDGFIAYRIANGFAIVLEEPVCAEEHKIEMLKEFDDHCRKMSLKTAFYRVDESSVSYFQFLKKQKLLIGQEAVLEVDRFTLEGKDKKSLRNGLNSLQKKGYTTQRYAPPLDDAFVKELQRVSDEWLEYYNKKELVFSQGMFLPAEIKKQDVIAVKNADGQVKAFLNIIPDFAPDESTYDMIRKTADAPGGCMDALIIELIKYAKEQGLLYLNLGLVPMAGIDEPDNTAEQLMQYAYEKVKRFRQYAGLREFKEKYASVWLNKYLVYENDFDLLQLPVALNKVMQPRINT